MPNAVPEAENNPPGFPENVAEAEPSVSSEPEVMNCTDDSVSCNGLSDAEPENWPEPGPNWPEAIHKWQFVWDIHVILFGTCFLFIVFNSTLTLATLRPLKQQTGQRPTLQIVLQCMMLTLGLTRCASLYVDPYGAKNRLPFLLTRILWSIGYPCLTATFSLLLVVLLDTTKLTLGPPLFQKTSTILIFIACHFILVLSSETGVFLVESVGVLLLICQMLFATFGIVLGIGYSVVGYRIKRNFAPTLQAEHTGKSFTTRINSKRARHACSFPHCYCTGSISFSSVLFIKSNLYPNIFHISSVYIATSFPWVILGIF